MTVYVSLCVAMGHSWLDVVFGGLVLFPFWEKGVFMKGFVIQVCAFALVCVAVFFGGSEMLLAQGGGGGATPVQFQEMVSFGDIFSSSGALWSALATIVSGAIGLGLAIWGARYIFSIVRSMGR